MNLKKKKLKMYGKRNENTFIYFNFILFIILFLFFNFFVCYRHVFISRRSIHVLQVTLQHHLNVQRQLTFSRMIL